MANIMTPSISQYIFRNKINKLINLDINIMCLNSGSEANTLAMRIANIHKKNPVTVSMIGSFHGSEKPSIASHSCIPSYQKSLSDFMYNKNKPIYFIK